MYTVAGIDFSLTSTGVTVIQQNADLTLQPVIFTTEIKVKKAKGFARQLEIVNAVRALMPAYTVCFIEGYAYGLHTPGTMERVEMVGMFLLARYNEIMLSAAELESNHFFIPPTALKKFVTTKGNAKKDMMIKEVFKRWGYDAPGNDAADSYGLARLGEAAVKRHLYGAVDQKLGAHELPAILALQGQFTKDTYLGGTR